MRHKQFDLNMVSNTQKCEKREMYTVGHGVWQEN